MTDDELMRAVLAVLHEVAPEVDADTLDPRASLREQVDLDSMDFLNFVIGLKAKLGVVVPEADYPALATLDGCVGYLRTRLAGAPAPGP